ncbi:MAG: hypothetical protein IPG50_35435 [Myxococcales bacterium]|nr:hypothetical protein [Myxococcales bacterium]
MSVARRALLLLPLTLAAAGWACQWVVPLGADVSPAPADVSPATADGGADAPPLPPGPCDLALPPLVPSRGGVERGTLFAARALDFGPRLPVTGVGTLRFDAGGLLCPNAALDLDGIETTCPATAGLAKCVTKRGACDEDGGRDNAFANVLALLQGVKPGNLSLSAAMETGGPTLLIQVVGYSGEANDDAVGVFFYAATGTLEGPDGGPSLPRWDGTDTWKVEPRSVIPSSAGDVPLRSASEAWVANGVLVAKLDRVDLPILVDKQRALLPLRGGFVTANVTQVDGRLRLDHGRLAAAVAADSLLANLAADGGVCERTGAFDTLRSILCSEADLTTTFPTEGPAAAPCGALSLAIGFVADAISSSVTDRADVPYGVPYATPCGEADGGPLFVGCGAP